MNINISIQTERCCDNSGRGARPKGYIFGKRRGENEAKRVLKRWQRLGLNGSHFCGCPMTIERPELLWSVIIRGGYWLDSVIVWRNAVGDHLFHWENPPRLGAVDAADLRRTPSYILVCSPPTRWSDVLTLHDVPLDELKPPIMNSPSQLFCSTRQ